jgi:hypothetical protein
MAAVPKHRSKAPQLTADYDHNVDILYVVNGEPRPAEGEDLPNGIVYRYALDDNSPCGVTIIGYRANRWHEKPRDLAEIIADHLCADVDQVELLVLGAAAAG